MGTLALLLSPVGLAAQAGSATWMIRGAVPDSITQATGGALSTFDLVMTMGTDGRRVGMLMTPGPDMTAGSLAMDLSTMRIQVIMGTARDSMSIGVSLPPDVAAMMGGGLGFRMDFAVPDSLPIPFDPDTIPTGPRPTYVNTGATDTVAGLGCEVWTMTSPADSSGTGGDLEMCLAPQPAAFKAFKTALGGRFEQLTSQLAKLAREQGDNPFTGRDLMAVRFRMTGEANVIVELQSISDAAPDASFFLLPAELQPFPMEMLQGMMGQQGQPTES
jgi:hypothetical protein